MGRREFFLMVAALAMPKKRPDVVLREFWRGRRILSSGFIIEEHVWFMTTLRSPVPWRMEELRRQIMARPLVAVSPREVMARIRQWQ